MKRARCLLILLVLLYITGCDGSPTTGRPATTMPSSTDGVGGDTSGGLTKPEKMCYGWNSELSVFGEEYALYHTKNGQLQFFDTASGTFVPYCFDPTCEHMQARTVVGADGAIKTEGGCISYELTGVFSLREMGSYYFSMPSLYRADREGRNREEIATITDDTKYAMIMQEYYTSEEYFGVWWLLYDIIKSKNVNGEEEWVMKNPLEERIVGITRISLTDGTVKEVFRLSKGYSRDIIDMRVYDGHLYFTISYLDVPYQEIAAYISYDDMSQYVLQQMRHTWSALYDYNLSTDSLTEVYCRQECSSVNLFNGFYAYQNAEEEGKVKVFSMNGDLICELRLPGDIQLPKSNSDRYLYYQYYENGRYTYGMYDVYNRELLHEIDSESFGTLQYVVGEGFYLWHNKSMYIRATDFWNKDLSKLISLE